MPTPPPTARLIPTLRRAVLASADAGPTDGELLGAFVRGGDQDAFAALVRRHGGMVLGVCRRVVGDAHAAEDAFQAAWLVLARRAASVRPREKVANWLYGVAYRTALKARAVRARRRLKEAQVDPMPHPQVPPPDAWSDLMPVLDAELARLPDRLRLPVVLCDLEGRPQREVARRLGLPPATLANRLASARRTLARRLTDRGIALSGGALAGVVTANAASAAVPPALAEAAVRAAGVVAAGGALAGAVPARVVQLSDGVVRMMMLAKLKSAAVALVALAAVAGGVGVGSGPALCAADEPAPAAKAGPAKPALGPTLDDRQFLRRVCLDLRGTPPTWAEVAYFVADPDPAKRKKVVGWLTEPAGDRVDLSVRLLNDVSASVRGPVVLNETHLNLNTARVAQAESLLAIQAKPAPRVAALDAGGAVRVWESAVEPLVADVDNGGRVETFLLASQPEHLVWLVESDEDFLTRVSQEARGGPPTAIEKAYFLADQDPKKREKLIDLLLKDPAVAKKVGPGWKERALAGPAEQRLYFHLTLRRPEGRLVVWDVDALPAAGRLDALLGQLLDGKRPDEQVLDALSAAVLGRLPTESERKLILANVGKAPDKPAAWREVLAALSGTEEAKKYAEELKARAPAAPQPEKK